MAPSTDDGRRNRLGAVAIALVLVATAAVGNAGATVADDPAQVEASPPAFVVALNDDGSARVTVSYTFDLTDDVRRAAFEELQASEAAVERYRDRFRMLLSGVASDATNATDREMSISDVTADLRTDGETGVVSLAATWEGLAADEDDQLTVTEPFASGFEPDRRFVIVTEGTVESVTSAPDSQTDGRLSWASGTSLDGFELVVNSDGTATADATGEPGGETDSPETAGDTGPGLDVLAGILALAGAVLVALWRR